MTEKLLKLSLFNTYEEIREAALAAQRERLANTKTGWSILSRVGSPLERKRLDAMVDLHTEQRIQITTLPLPKHMNPQLHSDRREARVKYFRMKFQHNLNTVYTDASGGDFYNATGVVVDYHGTLQDSLTMVGLSIAEAESGAILYSLCDWGSGPDVA